MPPASVEVGGAKAHGWCYVNPRLGFGRDEVVAKCPRGPSIALLGISTLFGAAFHSSQPIRSSSSATSSTHAVNPGGAVW
ncbi:hypothetical protein ACMHYB_21360 [Sorangium sp. So ce1128]